jgi:predicted HicB family RNase H-like nuclease
MPSFIPIGPPIEIGTFHRKRIQNTFFEAIFEDPVRANIAWRDMEYNGYIAKVEFDDEAEIFHGEVINLRDVITFQGTSVTELQQAFQESVEDYLAFCAERGEEPEKPFSGKFSLRIDPELHRQITLQARLANKSLNSWVNEQLQEAVAA